MLIIQLFPAMISALLELAFRNVTAYICIGIEVAKLLAYKMEEFKQCLYKQLFSVMADKVGGGTAEYTLEKSSEGNPGYKN